MKKLMLVLFISSCLFPLLPLQAQLPEITKTENWLNKSEVEMHLRFLASDELMGRRTTDPGNNVAARYIAEQLRAYGYQTVDGADGYYQKIPFKMAKPAETGTLQWGDTQYTNKEDMLILAGGAIDSSAQVVFANYGWIDAEKEHDDYKDLDVAGKVVVVLSGLPDTQEPSAVFQAMAAKRELAAKRGAVALVELYKLNFPWPYFMRYFSSERLEVAKGTESDAAKALPYLWLKEKDETATADLAKKKKTTTFHITSSGFASQGKASQNVIGMWEGSDPSLKDEYMILSAHYDHVGVGKQGGGSFTQEDSIFNGARDNGMGVVALLAAAKYFSVHPPRRSIVILAVTGEEMGLLGSRFYTDNPLIPLEKTVFNLNTDGAGYDTKEAISVIGYDRVGVEDLFELGAKRFGLNVIADPVPEQNLFDRSDNVNFAAQGIPAPTVSPGVTGFTEDIMKYYHQAVDNPESLDYDYVLTFCKTFAYIARLIADKDEAPRWKAGDKYEAAAKKLYGY